MNKDESLDPLLRRTSAAHRNARLEGACLDPETLAAWTDGSLTATERAAAETHTADCERCLAVLAAIAQTTPPGSTTRRFSWLSVRWLVPLATAAVAMTAWVLVQERPPSRSPVSRPAAPAVDAVAPAEPAAIRDLQANEPTRADASKKRESIPAREKALAKTRTPEQTAAKESVAAAPSPVADAAPPPVAAAAPAAPLPRSEVKDERFQLKARAALTAGAIASPDPLSRWRITGRTIERSTDGGRTWNRQPTGTDVDLVTGSSPATNVCWVVGKNGLVLLSIDGERWSRLAFPDRTVDLVAVTARDGLEATVTAANGRSFRTADGGRTWTLQENPATPF